VGRQTLADLPLAMPEHLSVLDACLAEITCGAISDLRPPWARVGWFATAESWILEQLDRLDAILIAPIVQVRSWSISCILRARTISGDVYFKASSSQALFAHEAALVQALATLYPDHLPTPLAVDQVQEWMLLADFGRILRDHAAVLPDASAVSPRLCDAYLALWTDYEPMPRLREAWALAAPLGALHQAVSYQHIVTSHELDWGVSFWVRQVFQSVP
jgi:phage tail protein X